MLQAQVTVVNLGRTPIVYAPSHLRLRSRGGLGATAIATGSAEGGRIGARTPHRFAVRFALADGSPLPRLAVADPGSGRTSVVDLGGTDGLKTLDLSEHHQPAPATGGHGR